MTRDAAVDPRAGYAGWVGPLCWTAVALEGFDLVVLGVVLPSLLQEPTWGLTPNTASLVSVVGLVGVMIGAMLVGAISDVIGRRQTVVWTVVIFSILTLACAFAPNPFVFGVLRFLAGLGLGGVLPTAIALVNEFARTGRGGQATTTLMTGYHVGAVATALLGILLITRWGWESMFIIGALPALVLVPLLWKYLPESEAFLRARAGLTGPATGAAKPSKNPVGILFHHGLARSTVAFWITSFMGLLLVYGLNTWLPQIMRAAGYELGAALALLLVLNVGAVIGLLAAGKVADRIGNRRSTVAWFAGAALFLALLSVKLPGFGVYLSVLLAGMFVFSAQVLVYAYISHLYPASARATAVGAASGFGRLGAISGPLIGGWLLTAGLAYPWGFYIFAVVAAIGALSIMLVNRDPAPDEPLPVTEDEADHIGEHHTSRRAEH
ncbi:MFS transporter [Pseudonocardia charpentierae]|uniref:Aromatic acid/H+ symport family MFS transporter n=1 Tax=Pseudonocardia charpentierae TaxID=3075545 RepID=A0ABU2NFL7_9PSEU|nr:aromatic acid/H+ symport family MFS transporter [Pseudonocardia sp. DSM 45834]MDT0352546.1 aromatic acid/H+ symport family MFS transporter [Pseudonocardia sp. DSM 45834]